MPNPDPSEIPRPLFARRPEFAPAPIEPSAERAESFHPQYVSLHTLREHGHGPRNLAWGVVTLALALLLLAVALFVVGPKAVLSVAVCLITFTALFVLARMHVFRQRNGGFLALGIVCLFGALMPLVELGFSALDYFVKSRPATVSSSSSQSPLLSLTEAFALTPPDASAGPRVKALKDSRVSIEGKSYLVKAGDIYALVSHNGRDVTVTARGLLVTLPEDAVEVMEEKAPAKVQPAAESPKIARASEPTPAAPANETPAQITERSQLEAMRRYPALGVKGSLENQLYVNLFNELRDNGGDEFFRNPEWPVELAELLAKRERWSRGAAPARVGPTTLPDDEPLAPALR